MEFSMSKFKIVGLLTLLIAVIAPLWAAVSSALGLLTGAAALICAGLYVINGSKRENGLKITLGLLAGNIWAYLVMLVMGALVPALGIFPPVVLYCVLFVFVIPAVFISLYVDKFFDLSSWLTGWAVTLTIFSFVEPAEYLTLLWHIAIAMVAGVWLIGVLITSTHAYLVGKWSKAAPDAPAEEAPADDAPAEDATAEQ